jgi:hypothetical protein
MKIAVSCALSDAVELAALLLHEQLSEKDIVSQLMTGIPDDEVDDLVRDALAVAKQRAVACPQGYPFEVSQKAVCAKPISAFNPYLFLLLGSSLKRGGAAIPPALEDGFRRYFEDLVRWSLRKAGFTAEVLSEPRSERGLPRSLKPALREICNRFGEKADLDERKLTSHDNDLGVDVVATFPLIDIGRSGRPVFLLQCATGDLDALESKITEKQEVFAGVWRWGFYSKSCIRGGATPNDLLKLERVYWDRLCEHGWVIDRMRIVQLAHCAGEDEVPVPRGLLKLWEDLRDAAPNLDWRNGWRHSLYNST